MAEKSRDFGHGRYSANRKEKAGVESIDSARLQGLLAFLEAGVDSSHGLARGVSQRGR
jgi:hypothetical protein